MRNRGLQLRVATAAVWLIASGLVHAQDWGWKEGRADFTRIVDGEVAKAIENYQKRLERLPGHGESLFGLAVAHTVAGDLEAALKCVEQSIDAGVPVERYLAGPRNLLNPLVASDAFQKLAKTASPLIHGPLLGAVSDASARAWVRTAKESIVWVEIREAGSERDAPWKVSGITSTLASRDFTASMRIKDLRPATEYEYRVVVDGVEQSSHRFRTFPKAGAASKFDVVFGGGAAYLPEYERVFTTIGKTRPLAFLQLGDNVYIDQPKKPAVQRYCYYRRQSSQPYRDLVASTNIAAIWDDHDFGDNDCIGGATIDEPPWKVAVWNVFRENWNNPSYGQGPEMPGCWFDFVIGDVHFVLLDCRMWRTKSTVPRKRRNADAAAQPREPADRTPGTMLGPAQLRWLKETLASSTATFKVITSSVPFALGVKPGSRDPWDGYPKERESIFAWVAEKKIEGVVLVAADRHRSDAWKIERPGAYDLYEFQSSRLTNIHKHGVMKNSLWGYNEDRSFGRLTFDTIADDPSVTYTVHRFDGEVVRDMTIRLSQLGFAAGEK